MMLAKIAAQGRIRRIDLYRTYDCQRRALHQPVLDRLLASGRVVKDSEDCLFVASVQNPAPVPSVNYPHF